MISLTLCGPFLLNINLKPSLLLLISELMCKHNLKPIKAFQSDHGREFDNDPFKKQCLDIGMVFRFSCPHTSSQNGKAEHMIRTINNVKRTLLFHASLPPNFWIYALETATYLLNILPTKALKNITPTHALF